MSSGLLSPVPHKTSSKSIQKYSHVANAVYHMIHFVAAFVKKGHRWQTSAAPSIHGSKLKVKVKNKLIKRHKTKRV